MGEYYQEEDLDQQVKLDSEEAMEFHYFKLHDYDGNNKLDGLELGAAMTHVHDNSEHSGEGGRGTARGVSIPDDELASLIQQILKEDDLNEDGFIDYFEFINTQRGGGGAGGGNNNENEV